MLLLKFSILTLFFSVITLSGCTQTDSTHSKLAGTWEFADSSGKMVMEFADKSRVKIIASYASGAEMISEGTYTIEPLDHQTTVVSMMLTTMGLLQGSDWLVRFIDGNTMKMQIGGFTRPFKWEEETNNTMTFTRKKQ